MTNPTKLMREVLANGERVCAPEPDGIVLVNGADLTPEPVRWLWPGWLALGKLHILAGAPGQGKTTIALALAATVTSGARWPDGTGCEPGNVLIWSGEDDAADTLLPRLLASGADRRRVYFVSGARFNGEMQPFDPSRDMQALQAEAARIGNIRLIVVDPVVSVVTGDSHKNTETRRALQPLVDLAAAMNAALVGITHFSKGGQGVDPAQRVVGSVAFTAVARVVMVAGKVGKEGEDRRILARAKSNIGPDEGGIEYHLEQSEPLPGIHASHVIWGDAVEGTAAELLGEGDARVGEQSSALVDAIEFLRDVLRDNVVPSAVVKAMAKEAGIAWRTIERASAKMGVKKRPGEGGKWYWSLSTSANSASFSHAEGGADISSSSANPPDMENMAELADMGEGNAPPWRLTADGP